MRTMLKMELIRSVYGNMDLQISTVSSSTACVAISEGSKQIKR